MAAPGDGVGPDVPTEPVLTLVRAGLRDRTSPASAPFVLAVDGRSGSGKTTLARLLGRGLRAEGLGVTVLHLDHVYPGWDGLEAAARLIGDDVLPALREGRPARYRSWSWVRDRPGPEITVTPSTIVLVEGVGAGSRAARALTDVLVWLDAPTPLRRRRAIARDGPSYEAQWDRWAAQEQRYLAAEQPASHADLCLETASTATRPPT